VDDITPYKDDRNAALSPQEFKETKKGKRVFLLGNGPPLRDWSMADLRGVGADTIGINRSWMSADAFTDPITKKEFEEHKGFQGTTYHCFVSGAHAYNLCDGKVKTGVVFSPIWLKWLIDSAECGCGCRYCFVNVLTGGHSPTTFRFDLNHGIMTKFAGYFALQIAAWMGYSEIFLLGFSAIDREGHAHDSNPDKGLITRGGMRRWFQGAADWANSKPDKTIVNCDPESAIDFFPKMGKEEVLERIAMADKEVVL